VAASQATSIPDVFASRPWKNCHGTYGFPSMAIDGTGISIRSSRTTPNRLSGPKAETTPPRVTFWPLLSEASVPPRPVVTSAADT
jgi:hypothetical protein